MEKGLKIVTIGGGSSYTPELMEGFIKRYNELPIKEIWLVDIEQGKEKVNIEVRGEIFMNKKTLIEVNEERKKNNQPPLQNCRNAAAGSIRQLDSKIADKIKNDEEITTLDKNITAMMPYAIDTSLTLFGLEENKKFGVYMGKDPLDLNIINLETKEYLYESPAKDVEKKIIEIHGNEDEEDE